jgi:radical SAM protein (TIGR01212 family)
MNDHAYLHALIIYLLYYYNILHLKNSQVFFGSMYYRTFSGYLKEKFGEKVHRVSLDAGFTCPNRDGTLGTHGCAYCSPAGSWNAQERSLPLLEQVKRRKEAARLRYKAQKFIAYFQAYSNTYAPVHRLKEIYDSVVREDRDFIGLAIGTRPDCVDEDKLKLIESYRRMGLEVWIEYGLQSANNATLELIGRGHTAEDFARAVLQTKKYDILVSTHVIIGLPGEKKRDIVRTAQFLAALPIDGLKIHNLNIVKNTAMADMYYRGRVKPLTLEEFAHLTVDFLEYSSPQVVVDRLVAETHPSILIEPKWSLHKHAALDAVTREFKRRNSFQGKLVGTFCSG